MEEENKLKNIDILLEKVEALAKDRGQEDILSMVETQCFATPLEEDKPEILNYVEGYLKCLISRLDKYHKTPINFLSKHNVPYTSDKSNDFFFRIENFDFNTYVWAKKKKLDYYMLPTYLDLYKKDLTLTQIAKFDSKISK
jgi:hypothetical protein